MEHTFSSLKSRPPLSRMLLIHSLLKKQNYPNRRNLAETLEISLKTVQRDIDFMRDRLNLPISYHEQNYGYYYSEKVNGFPNIEISDSEILALQATEKLINLFGTSIFEKDMRSALNKILENIDTPSLNTLSFKFTGNPIPIPKDIFQTLRQSLRESKELQFEYKSLKDTTHTKRHVHPYHLASINQQWYLFAYDLHRKDYRTFALQRMLNPQILQQPFQPNPKFKIEQHLADSFGVSTNSGQYSIRILFDPFAARLIQEKIWHPTQKLIPLKNGGLELRMTLGSLTEVYRWILSWGIHAQVIAPQKLIDRMKESAKTLSSIYLKK
jgi:predicted DNA-binding transcriptional regulator YafY